MKRDTTYLFGQRGGHILPTNPPSHSDLVSLVVDALDREESLPVNPHSLNFKLTEPFNLLPDHVQARTLSRCNVLLRKHLFAPKRIQTNRNTNHPIQRQLMNVRPQVLQHPHGSRQRKEGGLSPTKGLAAKWCNFHEFLKNDCPDSIDRRPIKIQRLKRIFQSRSASVQILKSSPRWIKGRRSWWKIIAPGDG